MKDGLYIGIILFLIAALVVLGFKKGCNKSGDKPIVVVADTSTYEKRYKDIEYEKKEVGAFNAIEKLNKEIDRLRDSLKKIKPRIVLHKVLVKQKDTIYTSCNEEMQLCSDYIDFQDQIILKKDSVIGQYVLRLNNCSDNLKFHKEFNQNTDKDKIDLIKELGLYKHLICRLYRKRKS